MCVFEPRAHASGMTSRMKGGFKLRFTFDDEVVGMFVPPCRTPTLLPRILQPFAKGHVNRWISKSVVVLSSFDALNSSASSIKHQRHSMLLPHRDCILLQPHRVSYPTHNQHRIPLVFTLTTLFTHTLLSL